MTQIPSSVYRVQVTEQFPLSQVTELIPYLAELGIEGIYTSPLFEAYESGYDVINPGRLNPDLGSYEDFERLCAQLHTYQMQFLLDVVPNHMGIKSNPWWLDVLEQGATSSYAEFFDINWDLNPKIVLPILNAPYEEALEKGEIQLIKDHGLKIRYFDYILPLNQDSQKWAETHYNPTPKLMRELLSMQFYKLVFWKEAGEETNYRRFFNINDLVAIHIENPKVLMMHHKWVFELLESGKVQGLRIDHPDGLYDPAEYFQRLRGQGASFVWAEKILDFNETLPRTWKVDGTVGYDFLNVLSGIFVQRKNEHKMTEVYNRFTEDSPSFQQISYERRKQYIQLHMTSELNSLITRLKPLSKGFTKTDLMQACMEIMACFPVYRTYIRPHHPIHKNDRKYIMQAVETGKQKAPTLDPALFDHFKALLLLEYSGQDKKLALDFSLRFQQLTPTIMAKGLEDSTFYIYNRLISLNEVGGNPEYFGYTKKEFHLFNQDKLRHHPLGALATSTHDTKFSEDARYRLHVLSEIPERWQALVEQWKKENKAYKTRGFPDFNTEYYIYQMLIAAWPADTERMWKCLNKAIREAGLYTSWLKINEEYEQAVKKFLISILAAESQFLHSFIPFHKEIAEWGLFNSLSALVLKMGSCGIVDLYQGNESIQFCLMDPDNRRPLVKKEDLKTFITRKALNFRKENKQLLLHGEYLPIKTSDNLIGFARKLDQKEVIVLAQRFFTEQEKTGTVKLPKNIESKSFRDVFTNQEVALHKDGLHLTEACTTYPFTILVSMH